MLLVSTKINLYKKILNARNSSLYMPINRIVIYQRIENVYDFLLLILPHLEQSSNIVDIHVKTSWPLPVIDNSQRAG